MAIQSEMMEYRYIKKNLLCFMQRKRTSFARQNFIFFIAELGPTEFLNSTFYLIRYCRPTVVII